MSPFPQKKYGVKTTSVMLVYDRHDLELPQVLCMCVCVSLSVSVSECVCVDVGRQGDSEAGMQDAVPETCKYKDRREKDVKGGIRERER